MRIEEILSKIKMLFNMSYTLDNQMPNVIILSKNIYEKVNDYNKSTITGYVDTDKCMGMDIVIDYKNVDAIKVGYVFE